MKLSPKYVSKAGMYCVTELGAYQKVKNEVKRVQQVHWFSSKEEANQFFNQ